MNLSHFDEHSKFLYLGPRLNCDFHLSHFNEYGVFINSLMVFVAIVVAILDFADTEVTILGLFLNL